MKMGGCGPGWLGSPGPLGRGQPSIAGMSRVYHRCGGRQFRDGVLAALRQITRMWRFPPQRQLPNWVSVGRTLFPGSGCFNRRPRIRIAQRNVGRVLTEAIWCDGNRAHIRHSARLLIVLPETAAVRAPFSSGGGCSQDRSRAAGPPNAAPVDVEDIASEAFVAVDWRRSGLVTPPPPGTGPGARGMSNRVLAWSDNARSLDGSRLRSDRCSGSTGSLHAFRSVHFLFRSISVPFNGAAGRHPASGPSIARAYFTRKAFRACCKRGDAIGFARPGWSEPMAFSDSRGSTQRFPHITLIDQRTARARK